MDKDLLNQMLSDIFLYLLFVICSPVVFYQRPCRRDPPTEMIACVKSLPRKLSDHFTFEK